MDKENLLLLKASFDRELSEAENEKLENALRNDRDLQEEAKTLQKLRDLMEEDDNGFSPFFTEKVMNRIEMLENNGFGFAFSRIAIPGLVAAVILLLISFWGGQSFSFDALMGIENLQPEYFTDFLLYSN
jgi:hypothetical protein